MAGSIKLEAPLGGSVTLNAVDTASNFTMSVPAAAGVLINADSATGAAQIPVGTTAQRPASPVTGQLRFNTTTSLIEVYNGTSWVGTSYTVEFLLVAGGGGAGLPNPGSNRSGAGGAGGLFLSPVSAGVASGTSYTVTIGAGGAGGTGSAATNGSNSVFGPFTVTGGGAGGSYDGSGVAGGSGGGGGTTTAKPGGVGISGQGFAGGTGNAGGNGGGGGGAGGAGSGSTAGVGVTSTYSGSSVTYAAGGPGTGATGAGTANSGNGGGCASSQYAGVYAGGSGIVIIRYLSSVQRGTGGTVTTSGGYYIHTFTSSGTFTA